MTKPLEALEKLADAGIRLHLAKGGSTPIYVSGEDKWFGICPNEYHKFQVSYQRFMDRRRQLVELTPISTGEKSAVTCSASDSVNYVPNDLTSVSLDDDTRFFISERHLERYVKDAVQVPWEDYQKLLVEKGFIEPESKAT